MKRKLLLIIATMLLTISLAACAGKKINKDTEQSSGTENNLETSDKNSDETDTDNSETTESGEGGEIKYTNPKAIADAYLKAMTEADTETMLSMLMINDETEQEKKELTELLHSILSGMSSNDGCIKIDIGYKFSYSTQAAVEMTAVEYSSYLNENVEKPDEYTDPFSLGKIYMVKADFVIDVAINEITAGNLEKLYDAKGLAEIKTKAEKEGLTPEAYMVNYITSVMELTIETLGDLSKELNIIAAEYNGSYKIVDVREIIEEA